MIYGFLEDTAAGAASAGGLATLMQIVPFILIIAIFYFMLIRPQKKKEKQTQAMLNAVQVGDDVVTIGGIYGTVVRIKDDKLFIETSKQEKTMIEIARWGIKDVLKYVEDK
jgi:preprotein translocase subunit YajC